MRSEEYQALSRRIIHFITNEVKKTIYKGVRRSVITGWYFTEHKDCIITDEEVLYHGKLIGAVMHRMNVHDFILIRTSPDERGNVERDEEGEVERDVSREEEEEEEEAVREGEAVRDEEGEEEDPYMSVNLNKCPF